VIVAHDLKHKSLFSASDHVESNDFIIDLYLLDRDPVRRLFVGRFEVYLIFAPSSRSRVLPEDAQLCYMVLTPPLVDSLDYTMGVHEE
jgi:hypothetical protein